MPLWAMGGQELIFERGTTGGAQDAVQLVSVNIVIEEGGFNRSAKQILPLPGFHGDTPYRDYAVTPDGEKFLVASPADQDSSGQTSTDQFNIVLNWFEELKERVPVP